LLNDALGTKGLWEKGEIQMPNIDAIEVRITTGSEGTDATIYLGICGREFNLDTSANDFNSGATDLFILKTGGNVTNEFFNNPQKPQLVTENLFSFPIWIRYAAQPDDDWDIQDVHVTVNPGAQQLTFISAVPLPLRLAKEFGEFCFLTSPPKPVVG
jgi:hypothetical protein